MGPGKRQRAREDAQWGGCGMAWVARPERSSKISTCAPACVLQDPIKGENSWGFTPSLKNLY
eukprot:scaffold529_cov308-Pinguiococcus_pyrenoidosus.AAC.86